MGRAVCNQVEKVAHALQDKLSNTKALVRALEADQAAAKIKVPEVSPALRTGIEAQLRKEGLPVPSNIYLIKATSGAWLFQLFPDHVTPEETVAIAKAVETKMFTLKDVAALIDVATVRSVVPIGGSFFAEQGEYYVTYYGAGHFGFNRHPTAPAARFVVSRLTEIPNSKNSVI